jgi:hypothetical protein
MQRVLDVWMNLVTASDYVQFMEWALAFLVFGVALMVLYYIMLRPALYAMYFRSNLPELRRGVFPDLLVRRSAVQKISVSPATAS